MTPESLAQRTQRLKTDLNTALVARRKYFMMAFACSDLAASSKNQQLSSADTAMLDEALDKFHDAMQLVEKLRGEIRVAEQLERYSKQRGLDL